jgi:hypothetical protein
MPGEVSDELMQRMVSEGYIVVVENPENYPINQQEETLYEFGKIPPESDTDARELFFKLYREAQHWQMDAQGNVYRRRADTRRHRRKRR